MAAFQCLICGGEPDFDIRVGDCTVVWADRAHLLDALDRIEPKGWPAWITPFKRKATP